MPAAPSPAPLILVVDDDEGMRLLMGDVLQASGWRVKTAGSGSDAIRAIERQPPDLMLLDLKLPDGDAPALLRQIERPGRPVPFIVVTGQGDERAAVEMMKSGAIDYVMKDTALLELLPAVVRRALAALERDRSLVQAQAERARLEREVLQISERERERFGADLHDGIGQRLTAIELMCAGLRQELAAAQPQLGERLGEVMQHLRETVAQTRRLARGLAPLDEQPEALQHGIEQLARDMSAAGSVACRIAGLTARPVRRRDVAGHLFRIAQEALNNAVKHSRATEITVRLEEHERGLLLEIDDNGQGFDASRRRGLGIGIMQYRANLIGAKLAVESASGEGTLVRCTLPEFP
ncbi:MAG TPA: response regulator [Opitutaceae bacterium]|jgi:signal transduction histidine kinase|nr:response regulator [Opitutaceae bacterium]